MFSGAAGKTIPFKDGTGNLKMAGDFAMDNFDDTIMFVNCGGSWLELCRSNNGQGDLEDARQVEAKWFCLFAARERSQPNVDSTKLEASLQSLRLDLNNGVLLLAFTL